MAAWRESLGLGRSNRKVRLSTESDGILPLDT